MAADTDPAPIPVAKPHPTTDVTAPLGLIPLPDAAEVLGVGIIAVHQLIKDGKIVAIADEQGRRCVPRAFLGTGQVLKALPSVITLLRDAKFSDGEIVDWLFRPDDSLPGTAVEALAANRGTEIKRRAQAAGF